MTTVDEPVRSEFQFLGCRLVRLGFEGRIRDDSAHEYRLAFDSRVVGDVTLDDGGVATEIALDVAVEFKDEAAAPFVLSATIAGLFTAPADFEHLERMRTVHAPALLYAQLRPICRAVVGEGGHSFVLPLVNVQETIERDQKASSSKTNEGLP